MCSISEAIQSDYENGVKSSIQRLQKKIQAGLPILIGQLTDECKVKEAFEILLKAISIKSARSNPYSMITLQDKNEL